MRRLTPADLATAARALLLLPETSREAASGRMLAEDSPAGLIATHAPPGIVVTTPDRIDAESLSDRLDGAARAT